MVEKPEYLALINPVPGLPEAAQVEMLAPFEPRDIFVVGKDGTYDQFIGLVRPPRIVLVAYAGLLAEQRGSADSRRDSMTAMKVAIHKRGSYIVQVGGLQSNKNWLPMRAKGEKMCGRLAKGQKSALNGKRGAKPWGTDPKVTAAEKVAMRDLWYIVLGKRTVDDALAEIKRKFGKKAPKRTVAYREFGNPVIKRKV